MSWLSSLAQSIVGALAPASPPPNTTAPPAPATLPTSILTAAVSTLSTLITALSAGLSNLSADEAAANDVMTLLGVIDPATIPITTAIEGAEWLLPILLNFLGSQRAVAGSPIVLGVPEDSRGR
jgi:hypothetical protein